MKKEDENVELARQNYAEESRLAAQMLDHAGRMRYAQYRAELEELAVEERGHASLLQGWIEKRGASVPSGDPVLKGGRNDWERLRQDYEDDHSQSEKYLRDSFAVDGEDPELAQLFLKIRKQEHLHRGALLRLVMRHDCYDS